MPDQATINALLGIGQQPNAPPTQDQLAAALMGDPFAAAAFRQRNAVMPQGGRQEGATTAALDQLGTIPYGMAASPSRLVNSMMGEYQPGMSVQDMPQTMQHLPEVAANITGAPGMMGGVPGVGMGIRAYHGSPYDFEKFDLSKIGTGEGAQAYGHGLYFAENPAVARQYRDNLTQPLNPAHGDTNPVNALWPKYADANGHVEFAGFMAPNPSALMNLAQRNQELIKTLPPELADAVKSNVRPGRMYEVNINAHPDQFLDWDKPLSQQTAQTPIADLAKRLEIGKGFRERAASPESTLSGSEAYTELAHRMGLSWDGPIKSTAERREIATNALRDAGIPGIKYLDQGSRQAGEGSRNYVVFNPEIIDILKKYGITFAPGAVTMANALMNKNEQ